MAATQVTPTQPTVVAGQSSALTPHTVLVCQNLEKYYGTRGNITKALDGINLSVARGEFIAIMGPSGSGKTTLLNCISTIDQASAGHIFIDDQELSSLRGAELSAFRRDRLGFIFQDANLLDSLTARENIALSLTIGHVRAQEVLERVENVAKLLQITEVLDKFPYEMSGGQRNALLQLEQLSLTLRWSWQTSQPVRLTQRTLVHSSKALRTSTVMVQPLPWSLTIHMQLLMLIASFSLKMVASLTR